MIPAGMAANVAGQIKKYGSGTVTLTRATRAAPDPSTPHIPGEVTGVEFYTLDARVDGVAAEFIDGTTIVATDRMVIASPKATDTNGAIVDIVPRQSDTLTVDGAVKVIKKIEAVPAAGPAARFHIFVAS